MAKKSSNGKYSVTSLGSMDEVEQVFKKFDTDGDGRISVSELRAVLKALGSETSTEEVGRVMAEIDKDGDGSIDLNEFAEFHRRGAADGDTDSKELREAFDLYDRDKNGLISARELHAVLKNLGEKCSLADCSRMIGSVDVDGDGCVNFEEFKKMMKV
ncbi:calcium-binding EF-hand family protein [Actinidia rufa]|uniref:Calcium-binding EF-hand family protein n=1 Tax=Actinidia rufa TaxID=165716 RepID=A0A7J0F4T0_9ERIC|nr:calcium-binding EF-hand family protein [Actinidia rufa]